MKRRRQVCLFGTSANPPTGDGGHTGIVMALCQMERFDEVRVLPVYRHTFSTKRHLLAPYDHRIKMCRLAFQSLPKAVVSTAEQKSFQRMVEESMTQQEVEALRVGTADLLEMLMEEEPDTDFYFCLGADTFIDLTGWKWRRSKDVLKLLDGRLVVLHRKGMTSDDLRDRIDALSKADGRGHVVAMEIPTLRNVSSSSVRSSTEEANLSSMVSPEVLEYMKENKLYAFSEDPCEET